MSLPQPKYTISEVIVSGMRERGGEKKAYQVGSKIKVFF